MFKPKTIVIDFNGTILDDRDLCVNVLNYMLESQGHPPVTLEKYLRIFTFPIINYYRAAGFNLKPEGDEDFEYLASIYVKEYVKRFDEAKLFDDVVSFLKQFQGKIKLVCLSASKHEMLIDGLKYLGIFDYFDDALGIKDIYAVSKLDVAKKYFEENKEEKMEDVLFIGDTLHDIEVAKELGAKCMIITRGHQCYEVVEKGNPDSIVSSFDEAQLLID